MLTSTIAAPAEITNPRDEILHFFEETVSRDTFNFAMEELRPSDEVNQLGIQ